MHAHRALLCALHSAVACYATSRETPAEVELQLEQVRAVEWV
jgi:hypothetical protein